MIHLQQPHQCSTAGTQADSQAVVQDDVPPRSTLQVDVHAEQQGKVKPPVHLSRPYTLFQDVKHYNNVDDNSSDYDESNSEDDQRSHVSNYYHEAGDTSVQHIRMPTSNRFAALASKPPTAVPTRNSRLTVKPPVKKMTSLFGSSKTPGQPNAGSRESLSVNCRAVVLGHGPSIGLKATHRQ